MSKTNLHDTLLSLAAIAKFYNILREVSLEKYYNNKSGLLGWDTRSNFPSTLDDYRLVTVLLLWVYETLRGFSLKISLWET